MSTIEIQTSSVYHNLTSRLTNDKYYLFKHSDTIKTNPRQTEAVKWNIDVTLKNVKHVASHTGNLKEYIFLHCN